jgi:hypothetical protein
MGVPEMFQAVGEVLNYGRDYFEVDSTTDP